MKSNYGTELSNTRVQACDQHFKRVTEEVILINRLAEEMQAEAATGSSYLSVDEAARLLTSCVGMQVMLGISRKIFVKLHKDAEKAEIATDYSAPAATDADAPYSAEEIARRYWDLIITQ